MNEIGLWVKGTGMLKDNDEIPDDNEGTMNEVITDHKMSNYLRLLEFFEVMGSIEDHISGARRKLLDVWLAFNAPATEFHIAPCKYHPREYRRWKARRELIPNEERTAQQLKANSAFRTN